MQMNILTLYKPKACFLKEKDLKILFWVVSLCFLPSKLSSELILDELASSFGPD